MSNNGEVIIRELIACWFEPKPSRDDRYVGFISPRGVWFFDSPSARWNPPDYFNNEDASATLRDAMPAPRIRHLKGLEGTWVVLFDEDNHDLMDDHSIDPDYKRAVVWAFLKFMEAPKNR